MPVISGPTLKYTTAAPTSTKTAGEAAAATLRALSPPGTNVMAEHYNAPTMDIQGFKIPTTERAMKAGTKAALNQLTLMLQANQITQDQFDRSVKLLTPTKGIKPQPTPMPKDPNTSYADLDMDPTAGNTGPIPPNLRNRNVFSQTPIVDTMPITTQPMPRMAGDHIFDILGGS